MRYANKILFFSLLLTARPGCAVEFEVMDKLAVNGAATLLSSATIIVPVTQSASLWASTSTVTPHLFVSTSGNVGIGTANPGAMLEVRSNAVIGGTLAVDGNIRLGDSTGDLTGINRAPETGVALSVDGDGTGGSYVVKFYSGGSLAGWIRKK